MNEWHGGVITERAQIVLAANPGIMTLDGTNTWIIREPGAERSVVIDPGPADELHLQSVAAAAGKVGLVLITHRHFDHTEGIGRFVQITGAPVRAFDPSFCSDAEPLVDGEVMGMDGLRLEIIATPGHTTDSMCVLLDADRSLLSGDSILGRGTSVIAHPDGSLGQYLDSMRRVGELVADGRVERILPGHGPVIDDPAAVVDYYLAHREERLEQVRAAVAAGATTAREVVERVYVDVDEILWPAAELSVAAQLDYLSAP